MAPSVAEQPRQGAGEPADAQLLQVTTAVEPAQHCEKQSARAHVSSNNHGTISSGTMSQSTISPSITVQAVAAAHNSQVSGIARSWHQISSNGGATDEVKWLQLMTARQEGELEWRGMDDGDDKQVEQMGSSQDMLPAGNLLTTWGAERAQSGLRSATRGHNRRASAADAAGVAAPHIPHMPAQTGAVLLNEEDTPSAAVRRLLVRHRPPGSFSNRSGQSSPKRHPHSTLGALHLQPTYVKSGELPIMRLASAPSAPVSDVQLTQASLAIVAACAQAQTL